MKRTAENSVEESSSKDTDRRHEKRQRDGEPMDSENMGGASSSKDSPVLEESDE